jgi:3-hydroxyacyl-CoA dehydrogenase
MFVFKAAVVGAGTMGGEIAQVIAAAEIPVVLKDVKQEFIDVGLAKAREVTEAQVARLVKKEKITEEQGRQQVEAVLGASPGPRATRASATSTSSSRPSPSAWTSSARSSTSSTRSPRATRSSARTPRRCRSPTSARARSRAAARAGRRRSIGFHFFYPASVMPLIEIVIGDDTDPDTVTTALNFAQAIKKQPITCYEVPGFVVNRILNSASAEVWRAQEEGGLSIQKVDQAIQGAQVAPMGPFFLIDLLGLDTVLHVAEHLEASYEGDRFYVHQGMQRLVARSSSGAKTGGAGFYKDGQPQIEGDAEPPEDLADRMAYKAILEACLVLEEGIATPARSTSA